MGRGRVAVARLMRVGVVFPGQGSQSVGMGGALAQRYPVAADLFAQAREILGYDLLGLITSGPDAALRETAISQPAIFVVNYALAVAANLGEAVVASAGHSFAEFCSLTLAGALSFEAALRLVDARAKAMQAAAERAPGAMAAILGLGEPAVRDAVAGAASAGRVGLANFNAPGQIVISGDIAAVDAASELARAAGAKRVIALNVSGAWHSVLMEPAREAFAPIVRETTFSAPRFAVISNVDAARFEGADRIGEHLVRSITDEVLWHATSLRLLEERLDLIVEFGGTAILSSMLKRLPDRPEIAFAGNEGGLEALARLVEGART